MRKAIKLILKQLFSFRKYLDNFNNFNYFSMLVIETFKY